LKQNGAFLLFKTKNPPFGGYFVSSNESDKGMPTMPYTLTASPECRDNSYPTNTDHG
jgi:hypothetical protein